MAWQHSHRNAGEALFQRLPSASPEASLSNAFGTGYEKHKDQAFTTRLRVLVVVLHVYRQ
jgi:hypothetical protein